MYHWSVSRLRPKREGLPIYFERSITILYCHIVHIIVWLPQRNTKEEKKEQVYLIRRKLFAKV